MIRDTTLSRRWETFVHNHPSSPSWPALAQGFRRPKKTFLLKKSTDEARSSPGSDSGNATSPGTPAFGPTVETMNLLFTSYLHFVIMRWCPTLQNSALDKNSAFWSVSGFKLKHFWSLRSRNQRVFLWTATSTLQICFANIRWGPLIPRGPKRPLTSLIG